MLKSSIIVVKSVWFKILKFHIENLNYLPSTSMDSSRLILIIISLKNIVHVTKLTPSIETCIEYVNINACDYYYRTHARSSLQL